jgi:HSP20 family protein
MTKEKAMAEVKEAPKPKTQNVLGQTRDVVPRTSTAPLTSTGSPFAFLRRFAQEMDHLFEDFGVESGWHLPRFLGRGRDLLRREAGFVPAEWSPRVEVLEREGKFVVRADLPGMSKDDIKVEVGDDLLTIQGERANEKKEEREGYCYSECSYGSFYRAIPLPEGAEASKATADFRNGVLEVTVPATSRPEQKARRVEVREAK